MVRILFLTAAVVGAAASAMAAPNGRISVIDGDTIRVGGETVRLFGIDAPETDQTCTYPDGREWDCGLWAAREVRKYYEGKRADCRKIDTDVYGRTVAQCAVDGADMGATIVNSGMATAFRRYSDLYVEIEKGAVVAGRGIFSSDLTPPAEHRAARRPAPQAAPGTCAIKGNISSNGRIYHLPGQEHYADTRIDTSRGERWFCSEDEARSAGWRRARR